MEARKEKLGADHPDTLTSMANLASTYRNQGRWQEAENLVVHVMEATKEKLGADHPDTLSSMANLAFTYREQKRWKEAFVLLSEAVQGMQQVLGPDHPEVTHYIQEQVKMKDYLHCYKFTLVTWLLLFLFLSIPVFPLHMLPIASVATPYGTCHSTCCAPHHVLLTMCYLPYLLRVLVRSHIL